MKREDLLKEKSVAERINLAPVVPFITTFFVQHQTIKHLGNDMILNTVLPTRPQVVYKGAPSLRNRLAPNTFDPLVKKT